MDINTASSYAIYKPVADIITRRIVLSDTQGSLSYKDYVLAKTDLFISNLYQLHIENNLLKIIAKNLWDTHIYNKEYIAFLLGVYTEEEFASIANKYAVHFDDSISAEEIDYASSYIPNLLQKPIDVSDLSLLLNVNCNNLTDLPIISDSESSNK
jgi:hypothetical protein